MTLCWGRLPLEPSFPEQALFTSLPACRSPPLNVGVPCRYLLFPLLPAFSFLVMSSTTGVKSTDLQLLSKLYFQYYGTFLNLRQFTLTCDKSSPSCLQNTSDSTCATTTLIISTPTPLTRPQNLALSLICPLFHCTSNPV